MYASSVNVAGRRPEHPRAITEAMQAAVPRRESPGSRRTAYPDRPSKQSVPITTNREHELHAGEVLHSAISKVYLACLRQMDEDPRWYQRPFVYGLPRR